MQAVTWKAVPATANERAAVVTSPAPREDRHLLVLALPSSVSRLLRCRTVAISSVAPFVFIRRVSFVVVFFGFFVVEIETKSKNKNDPDWSE